VGLASVADVKLAEAKSGQPVRSAVNSLATVTRTEFVAGVSTA
jgi:hypothetical protein